MNYRRDIPTSPQAQHSFGRRVNHDPRSLAYKVTPNGTVASKRWQRVTPVLDQGDLGSCTGNAACGLLGTEPFRATLTSSSSLNEAFAVRLYSDATKLDSEPKNYPPDDTGSDGLSVAKACLNLGLISGYQHITSLSAAFTAIQSGPFIVGTDFYAGMEDPDINGLVKMTGAILGGHEYEVLGYDAVSDLWECVNSWGTSWGVKGHFFYSSTTFSRLMSADGDATVFVPLSQPAPTPMPAPTPVVNADQVLADATHAWAAAKHTGSNKTAAAAVNAWRVQKGL